MWLLLGPIGYLEVSCLISKYLGMLQISVTDFWFNSIIGSGSSKTMDIKTWFDFHIIFWYHELLSFFWSSFNRLKMLKPFLNSRPYKKRPRTTVCWPLLYTTAWINLLLKKLNQGFSIGHRRKMNYLKHCLHFSMLPALHPMLQLWQNVVSPPHISDYSLAPMALFILLLPGLLFLSLLCMAHSYISLKSGKVPTSAIKCPFSSPTPPRSDCSPTTVLGTLKAQMNEWIL